MIWVLRGLIVGVILYDWYCFATIKLTIKALQAESFNKTMDIVRLQRDMLNLLGEFNRLEHQMKGDGK